jgi:hypothetical protein
MASPHCSKSISLLQQFAQAVGQRRVLLFLIVFFSRVLKLWSRATLDLSAYPNVLFYVAQLMAFMSFELVLHVNFDHSNQ